MSKAVGHLWVVAVRAPVSHRILVVIVGHNWIPTAVRPTCTEFGRCVADSGECVVRLDADCRASQSCRKVGDCTAEDGYCRPALDSDCQTSELCERIGACTAEGEECIQQTDDACRQSFICRAEGACNFDGETCRAVSDVDCLSAANRPSGQSRAEGGICTYENNADCRASLACSERGRCELDTDSYDDYIDESDCIAVTEATVQSVFALRDVRGMLSR